MPTIDVNLKDLQELVGRKLSLDEVKELACYAKSAVDSTLDENGNFRLEVSDTNRPDLLSTEGIARELKGQLGLEKGLPVYKLKDSGLSIIVDESVKGIRPIVVGAVVKNVKVTEQLLVQLIQLQEKVCLTYGRKRKEAAIGIYDFDKIKWPITYKAFKPRALKFKPLESGEELYLDEILEQHPKGREYAHLLKGLKAYPILIDAKDEVCSMPPIINSATTGKVSGHSTSLFVEATGNNLEVVITALNVIVCALAERKARVEGITIVEGKKKTASTNLDAKEAVLDKSFFEKISGLMVSEKELVELLAKRRITAEAKNGKIKAGYPAYRNDIMHEIDLAEDALISFGFNEVDPELPKLPVNGSELKEAAFERKVREACIGLGLQETMTFHLTSKEKQEKKMNLKKIEFAEIANPISLNSEAYRKSIIPELLEFIAGNKHVQLPQAAFELGRTVHLNKANDNGVEEKKVLTILLTASEIDFTKIKSVLQALSNAFGWPFELAESRHESFIEGRQAVISFKDGRKGILGEINPVVLENFGLENPVAALEIEI
ncbi:phenylalanine--tRNA ligase subunit beta [archaeon]|nr:phenylalanine--tRNA ligase subunit beta [archaeon]